MLVLDPLREAQDEGVLSPTEEFELEALAHADTDAVPDSLLDAVERLAMWFLQNEEGKKPCKSLN